MLKVIQRRNFNETPEDSKVVAVACVPHEEEEITDNIPDTPENTENQE